MKKPTRTLVINGPAIVKIEKPANKPECFGQYENCDGRFCAEFLKACKRSMENRDAELLPDDS